MNISEETFGAWAKGPAATEQSRCENAEAAVKKAIAGHELLSKMNITVLPHGSYRNRTNVRQESDVDICVRLNTTFFASYPEGKKKEDFGNTDGSIDYASFKGLVQKALVAHFGQNTVHRGNKAFDIHANTHRVDADVLAAFEYRSYTGQFNPDRSHHYHSGVGFDTNAGKRIVNWPEQTHANGVLKHDATNKRYKRAVRILKRLRNAMQDKGNPAAKDIASCLIESLVWNVPQGVFGKPTYSEDIRGIIAHAYEAISKEELCREWTEVNGMKGLFTPDQPWSKEQAKVFLLGAWKHIGFQ